MQSKLHTWQSLITDRHAALRQAAAHTNAGDVRAVAALRKAHPADLTHAALQLAQARLKAIDKFGPLASTLIADIEGVAQAGHRHISRYKAQRLAQGMATPSMLVDLCCGIGTDARAFREAGMQVLAIDRDPVRAWMTAQNAQCDTRVADVESLDLKQLGAALFHIDPSRRSAAGRAWRLDDYQPGPVFLHSLVNQLSHGAIVFGPGIDCESVDIDGEIEFISLAGRLMQAVLWTGNMQQAARRATVLSPRDDGSFDAAHLIGEPDYPPTDELSRYVYTVDPAAERAALLGALCKQLNIRAAHPALGLLTSDRLIHSPWLNAFELIDDMPWREARVRQRLNELGAGIVEVKTRDKAVNPDALQQKLRGSGDRTLTLFVHRWDRQVIALITQRIV